MRHVAEGKDYRRTAERLLLAFGALCFVLLARYHWRHICDDAFIDFRYADNVVAGLGPAWNRGEAVEGYSSPLWLGLLVVGRWLGVALPGWAAAWGTGFGALCLLLAHRFAFAVARSRLVAAASFAAASLVYPLYYWAPAGLETALFTMLVATAAWALAGQSSWAWALVAGLLGVARPEGPLLVCVLIVLAWLAHGRAALRPGPLALALAPALAWLVFRRAYYGEWLANTYYAKATGAFLFRLAAGARYALPGMLALAAACAAMVWGGIAGRRIVVVLAFAGVLLVLVVGAGGDWMWHGRMLLPALLPLVVVTVVGIASAPAQRRFALVLAGGLGWAAVLPPPALLADALAFGRLPERAYQEGTLVAASRAAARFIAANYSAEALVAVNHAGALPQALPNPVLDMTGLCDRHIAHDVAGGVHRKFDPAYVLARRPRLVVLNSRTRPGTAGRWYHPGYWDGETALFAQPEFQASYRPVPRFWDWQWQGVGGGGYVLLFERVPE
jgi:arabinofuranosyltransferase